MPIKYRRLPGRAIGLVQRRTLWLAPDHILSVRSIVLAEQYRRFYLRDIQAIVLTRSGNGWAYYLFASAAFLLLMFVLLGYSWHPFWAALCGVTSLSMFLAGMRMPNCFCYLRTATTTEHLPSLGRLRAAKKTLAILVPAIQTAQAPLAAEPASQPVSPISVP